MAEDGNRQDPKSQQEQKEFAESSDTLWQLTLGPVIWALHFLTCYVSAAIFCAKTEGEAGLAPIRIGILVITLVALAAISWLGWQAWRAWNLLQGEFDYVHSGHTEESRHRFLGHAAFLLCGLSFVGVVYTALPAAFIETCR